MEYENGLFIFRRDLRVIDNNGLNFMSKVCKQIYTIFIFTPEQVGPANAYRSHNSVQFMIESLQDLANQLQSAGGHLHCFYANNDAAIRECIKQWNIDIVGFNLDITPYAKSRDSAITEMCNKLGIHVALAQDYFLNQPGTIKTVSGESYQKFTPYYLNARKLPVQQPSPKLRIKYAVSTNKIQHTITLSQAIEKFVVKSNPNIMVHGGRTNALEQLKTAAKNIHHYSRSRDTLSMPTSHLSAYIKFGNISIREVYKAFKSNTEFIRELYWREFYADVLYHFPHVLGHALTPKYDKIRWGHNKRWFNAWAEGRTGFPILDAAQRQLLKIGWVHNRGRMISSSILTKIMFIDWRMGERFYAQHLVDYDVANNNGGWTWAAGVGADSQEYWRTFNPFIQSKEHDPECEYIKLWIPELKDVPAKDIHNWDKEWAKYKNTGYPGPILNYAEQKEKVQKAYIHALSS